MNNNEKHTKVTSPISDFVSEYKKSKKMRFHMPGHKGKGFLGCEDIDITEISGADVLYSADGIIAESEDNATRLFGTAHTFYSTEGSSLSIKAMLALAVNGIKGKKIVLAARNAHKAFVFACALLDIDIEWIYPEKSFDICSCRITAQDVEKAIDRMEEKPCAVYITSPDYLGNIADIKGISQVCKRESILFLADNAHGAYLKFLPESRHPIDFGVDMCCDSAHKTLPVLTGGGYLHISKNAPSELCDLARNMLSVFASTSPSYLILQSLDACNPYLATDYADDLREFCEKTGRVKERISSFGFCFSGDEPLKLVILASKAGYTGYELQKILSGYGAEAEFADELYLVLMLTPQNTDEELSALEGIFEKIPVKKPVSARAAAGLKGERVMSVRQAVFSKRKKVGVREAIGCVCACPTVSCPPAVPITVSGERITEGAADLFERYGIYEIEVVDGE